MGIIPSLKKRTVSYSCRDRAKSVIIYPERYTLSKVSNQFLRRNVVHVHWHAIIVVAAVIIGVPV